MNEDSSDTDHYVINWCLVIWWEYKKNSSVTERRTEKVSPGLNFYNFGSLKRLHTKIVKMNNYVRFRLR